MQTQEKQDNTLKAESTQGQILYLGGSCFQIAFENQRMIIDPDFRWLQTGLALNKKDPVTFTLMDSLKQKVSVKNNKNIQNYIENIDFILISSPQYPYMDQLRLIAEKNNEMLVLAPQALIDKIRNLIKSIHRKKQNQTEWMALDPGESVRFTSFVIDALHTEKDRSMIQLLNDSDKNSQSFSIQCGDLQLYYACKGATLPPTEVAINTALLPMNYSKYKNTAHLQKFIDRFSPDLVIPYAYDQKAVQEIKTAQSRNQKFPQIHFPQLGEAILWNA